MAGSKKKKKKDSKKKKKRDKSAPPAASPEYGSLEAVAPASATQVRAPERPVESGPLVAISLRVPGSMLESLKQFAELRGVGYQVLMKRWLDDRIRQEGDAPSS